MRIGVDAVPLQKLQGGVNYYIFFLLDELIKIRPHDTFFLFTNEDCRNSDIQYFERYKNVKITPCPPSSIGHSLWAQTMLSYACWANNIDVFVVKGIDEFPCRICFVLRYLFNKRSVIQAMNLLKFPFFRCNLKHVRAGLQELLSL